MGFCLGYVDGGGCHLAGFVFSVGEGEIEMIGRWGLCVCVCVQEGGGFWCTL